MIHLRSGTPPVFPIREEGVRTFEGSDFEMVNRTQTQSLHVGDCMAKLGTELDDEPARFSWHL